MLNGLASCPRQVASIKCFPNQRLDHRLPADVQFRGHLIQFAENGFGKIHVHPSNSLASSGPD